LTVDREAYDAAMEEQRARARAGSKFGSGSTTVAGSSGPEADDRFVGYDQVVDHEVEVLGAEPPAQPGGQWLVWLDRTPFYVEAGGQVSDSGWLESADGLRAVVEGLRKPVPGHPRTHLVRVLEGEVRVGQRVTARVDATVRAATQRNHTATHLLHAALRQQLGTHVHQKGSLVAPDRLRFDFTHGAPLTDAERHDIERLVNEHIYRNSVDDIDPDVAIADRVRVVTIRDFSVELCGGTHVKATGDIGPFVITEESGIAAGVRRIEALTGEGAVSYIQQQQTALQRVLAALNASPGQAPEVLARLQSDLKRLARENEQLKMKLALGGGTAGDDGGTLTVGDATLVTRRVTGLEKNALRGLSDSLRARYKRGVVVLAAEQDDKVQVLVSVTPDLTSKVKAGQLVKELAPIVGGGGGGRPDFAEAGGKDPSGIDALLARAKELVTQALS
jgi:alanyl-tRNA synthetase